MKSQLTLKKAFATLLLSVVSIISFAQTQGKLAGTVSDKKTGETLIGVSVKLAGTTTGVGTDVDGKYTLALAAGKHTIEISYVGYTTKKITDVEIKAGATTNLNIVMEEANSQTLKQVVVTANFKQESNNSLYMKQKNSATIGDGISSESIRRSPDRNTSDVLKRVSGATIQDNKFVVVRGLSDRYNTALLDGAPLPSTEPNRKAFSFDIVPSNLVDNLIISKTATPDLPADFTGGAVQIVTKDIPDQNFASFGIGSGYNTVSTFKDFKSGVRNATDYFGFDHGDKQLSSSFPSTNSIINRTLTSEQNLNALRRLPRNWNIYTNSALPSQNYQFTLGRVKSFNDNKNNFGALFSLTYRNSQNINSEVIRDYYDYNYSDNVYKFSTSLGGLANFAYKYRKSKITLKNIYNRAYDDQFLSRDGFNKAVSSDVRFFAFDLMQKSLFKSTLEGDHQVGNASDKINWSLSYSNTKNNQPDQRKVNYLRNPSDIGTTNYLYVASVTTAGRENTRLFSDLNEDGYSANLNYSHGFKMFGQGAILKTGLASSYRDRKFDARFIGMVINNSAEAQEIRTRSLDRLFAADALPFYTLDEIPNNLDSYTANSNTNAAYAMLDNKIGERSRLVWGARVEQFSVNLKAKVPTAETTVDQNYIDVLPSLNYTYKVTEKSNFRASYYRTLARPEFRELSSAQFFDYEMLANLQGNPNLKRALVDNADIRFEIYPSAGQVLSVTAFYKKFKNAIETFNFDGNSTRTITYFNSDKVNVYGVEFEVRKSLDFIYDNDFMKNTTAYVNLSLVKSKVDNGETGLNLIDKTRPMVGQAPYVINGGLQHAFLNNRLTFNALYNKVGRRLSIASGALFPSVWEAPRDVIDFQIGFKVIKNRGELKFNAGDILNQRITLYYDINTDKKYDRGSDQTLSSFKPGSNYSLSFSYNF